MSASFVPTFEPPALLEICDVLEEEEYNLIVYAQERTPYGGRPWAEPAEENIDIHLAIHF